MIQVRIRFKIIQRISLSSRKKKKRIFFVHEKKPLKIEHFFSTALKEFFITGMAFSFFRLLFPFFLVLFLFFFFGGFIFFFVFTRFAIRKSSWVWSSPEHETIFIFLSHNERAQLPIPFMALASKSLSPISGNKVFDAREGCLRKACLKVPTERTVNN